MEYVLITHEVADYPAWKKVFDSAAGLRRQAGEHSYQVLHYECHPRKVVHFSAWTSLAKAKAFFESPQLVRLRAEAGWKHRNSSTSSLWNPESCEARWHAPTL